jgi:hypothetical protein
MHCIFLTFILIPSQTLQLITDPSCIRINCWMRCYSLFHYGKCMYLWPFDLRTHPIMSANPIFIYRIIILNVIFYSIDYFYTISFFFHILFSLFIMGLKAANIHSPSLWGTCTAAYDVGSIRASLSYGVCSLWT